MTFRGLFVGLVTVDLVYLTELLPQQNQKIVALEQMMSAGGPATNAAVTFSCLGGHAKLLGIVGNHPLSQLIGHDLANHSVNLVDLQPDSSESPPVSSIFVTQSTGERAVISVNATKSQAKAEQLPTTILQEVDVVLIDGHQMELSVAIAPLAKQLGIPLVLDGGSWKPGLEQVLPTIDYAICSADFYPPDCQTKADVFAYLQTIRIPHIAITQGEKPIQYWSVGKTGEINVPQIPVKDTLGAGDIFHGAFCYYLQQQSFISALTAAGQIASHSCRFFGTRQSFLTNFTSS